MCFFFTMSQKGKFFYGNKHEYIKGFNKVVKLAVPYGEGNHKQGCVGLRCAKIVTVITAIPKCISMKKCHRIAITAVHCVGRLSLLL